MLAKKLIRKMLNLKGLFVTSYHLKIRHKRLNLWVKRPQNACLFPHFKRQSHCAHDQCPRETKGRLNAWMVCFLTVLPERDYLPNP